jgi:hypothetical protein
VQVLEEGGECDVESKALLRSRLSYISLAICWHSYISEGRGCAKQGVAEETVGDLFLRAAFDLSYVVEAAAEKAGGSSGGSRRQAECWMTPASVEPPAESKSHLVFQYDLTIESVSHIPLLHGVLFLRCDLGRIQKVSPRLPVRQHQIFYHMKCACLAL